jgi:NADPH:quinone reductase-like Zn-dependent oxidoreductase
MVVKKARLLPGQTLLVQAAGSGVSSAAIQIARRMGLRVIATASTDEKCERAKQLGAHETINSTNEDFVAVCKKLTDKRGVDGAIEHVGGEVFVRTVLATAWGGRVVTCGATAGFAPTVDLRQIFFRQVEVLGSTMGSKGDLFDALKLVRAGELRPVVDRSMSLWDAALGHRALEARKAFGKIVFEVD